MATTDGPNADGDGGIQLSNHTHEYEAGAVEGVMKGPYRETMTWGGTDFGGNWHSFSVSDIVQHSKIFIEAHKVVDGGPSCDNDGYNPYPDSLGVGQPKIKYSASEPFDPVGGFDYLDPVVVPWQVLTCHCTSDAAEGQPFYAYYNDDTIYATNYETHPAQWIVRLRYWIRVS